MTTVVAIDLGASSGRVLRGVFDGERLAIEECSRFPNGPVAVPGPRRSDASQSGGEAQVAYEWDILALWRGILEGLREASLRGAVDAIGIDTWAVDYGLLDEGGRLIGNPASYRSARCGVGASEVLDRWDSSWLYEHNGLQFQPFNTLFQRVADQGERRADCARTALLIPDLLAYWLTGEARSEVTNASTTGLVNARTRRWDLEIIERMRDDFGVEHLFAPLISPGEVIGEARVAGRIALIRLHFERNVVARGDRAARPGADERRSARELHERAGSRRHGPLPHEHHGHVGPAGVPAPVGIPWG